LPYAPPHPCAEPRCHALVHGPRCAAHTRKPFARTYAHAGGRAWQRTRARIFQRDGHRCRYCGGPAEVVDHILNRARGGSDDDSNLAACCRRCNEAKRR
jgi:5-methylcytosine-specific restriction endonuclease McrA